MTTIKQGSVVELEIELIDGDGDILETTEDSDALEVRVGDGELPPTVEEALNGLEVGGAIDVTCPAGEAFGPHDPEAIVSVPREDFPEDMPLEKGIAIGVTVYGVVLVASLLWNRHFLLGPCEWLWRWFTYLQRPPIRRHPQSAAPQRGIDLQR